LWSSSRLIAVHTRSRIKFYQLLLFVKSFFICKRTLVWYLSLLSDHLVNFYFFCANVVQVTQLSRILKLDCLDYFSSRGIINPNFSDHIKKGYYAELFFCWSVFVESLVGKGTFESIYGIWIHASGFVQPLLQSLLPGNLSLYSFLVELLRSLKVCAALAKLGISQSTDSTHRVLRVLTDFQKNFSYILELIK
jgi:hypothetical protein